MSARQITIAGFLLIVAAAVVLDLLARRPGARWPTFSRLMTRIMATRATRLSVLTAWFWWGWHMTTR
ncbi:MAG: hypothetical protein H6513_15615 [Acidimicrobiaceae bacterium]|nr:hypothetical protein [Actinomycetota bacterium]MCB9382113.1 hypothetical protein [Acidimicrobiaceae bacterium]